MGNDIKNEIKKIAKKAEVKTAELLLKFQERRDGKDPSDAEVIEKRSKEIADKANEIIMRRGKTILKELKDAYKKGSGEEDKKD